MTPAKPFVIPKRWVREAHVRVKANRGVAGIDGRMIQDFDRDRNRHLNRIWNRLSSGSYFPPAVKVVPISRKSCGERVLGVPTVNRIPQTVVTRALEPLLAPVFHDDSYDYRRGGSANDALTVMRKRCWERDWVLEYDIGGLFDHIDHALLLKALRHHCGERWVSLYVEHWLRVRLQGRDGALKARTVKTLCGPGPDSSRQTPSILSGRSGTASQTVERRDPQLATLLRGVLEPRRGALPNERSIKKWLHEEARHVCWQTPTFPDQFRDSAFHAEMCLGQLWVGDATRQCALPRLLN